MKEIILSIVLPCFNEDEVLPLSIPKLKNLLENLIAKKLISDKSFLCFVDDGSKDSTWKIIKEESKKEHIKALKLSNNCGHQSAILAGMMAHKDKVNCVITIDVDLQDDIGVIEKMLVDYKLGHEIVYGIRTNRETDTFFKKWPALLHYKLMNIIGIQSIYNHADYRLVGSEALKALSQFREKNLYLRGLFPVLGFKTSMQYYDRIERKAGKPKYTTRKSISLAWDGITSFSTKPIRIAIIFGWISILISIGIVGWVIYAKMTGKTVFGWASTIIPICFIGGVQFLLLGIIGEYIGKIYLETKQRPRYVIEEVL